MLVYTEDVDRFLVEIRDRLTFPTPASIGIASRQEIDSDACATHVHTDTAQKMESDADKEDNAK